MSLAIDDGRRALDSGLWSLDGTLGEILARYGPDRALLNQRVPSLDNVTTLLRVHLGGTIVGLPASSVRELVRAVAITSMPGAPPIVEGVVNVRGQLVPVIDVRRRLALPARTLDPNEFLVIMHEGTRTFAMRVDDVDDLVDISAGGAEPSADLSPALRDLAGLAARADGVLVIYDPAAFVSQAEAEAVDALLSTST